MAMSYFGSVCSLTHNELHVLTCEQVEKTLYKLHRSFLCQEPESAFSSMFDCPQPSSQSELAQEGSSDDNPIVLPDLSSADFALFVPILYAKYVETHI